jgi:hypothetical protein
VRPSIQPATPEANRENADQACAAIALVRVFYAHGHFTLICPNSQLTSPGEIRLQPQAALPAETPIRASAVKHGAGETLTDAFVEDRLPRYDAEWQLNYSRDRWAAARSFSRMTSIRNRA